MIRTRGLSLALLIFTTLVPFPHAQDGAMESMLGEYIDTMRNVEPIVLAREGELATEAQLNVLREKLLRVPNDAAARAQLLGYYHKKEEIKLNERKERAVLIYGVIRQQPDSQLAGSPYCALDPDRDAAAYQRAADLWLDQVRQKPSVLPVLRNAGDFLSLRRPEDAQAIYENAGRRQPESAEWPEKIGLLHLLQAHRAEGGDRKALAARSLAAYTQAVRLTPPADQFRLIDRMARAAYEAGDDAQAERAAHKLLDLAERRATDPDYGNALHQGHTILGLVALRRGDTRSAMDQLAAAGQAPPSDRLRTLGPSVALARDLAQMDDPEARSAVVRYLDRVNAVWPEGASSIAAWQESLRNNQVPSIWTRME